MALQRFTLTQSPVTIFEKSSDALPSIAKLSNDRLYYISLPYYEGGLTSWAIAQGGDRLNTNAVLGISPNKDDATQQFAILSNDEGATRYLYHGAEKMFVGKNGQLTDEPIDPIYFAQGAYDTTFVAYFDAASYVNVDSDKKLVINENSTPNQGNSIVLRPAKTFNSKAALAKFPAVEVTEITLNHSSATLMAGEALSLQATVSPSYATDATVAWSTSDASVAIVVRGVVTAVSPGVATITAKAGNREATCVVTVEKRYVAVMGLILSESSATVTEGEMLQLTATVTPADADDKTVTWESSDTTIAIVVDGLVTALSPGKVSITAKAGERQASCVVTVEKRYVPVTDIILNYTELTLAVGESVTLTATIVPADADDQMISWSTSDSKVATINRKRVRGVAPGTAIITAATTDYTATCVVTVTLDNGIDDVVGAAQELMIYDVAGRPVRLNAKSTQGLEAGTYIINGHKVVVK